MSTVDLSVRRRDVAHTDETTLPGNVEVWMQEHGASVLRLAYAFLLDRHQAEDVYQEVFVKAHHHADRLQDPTRVRSWLLQTTANRCKDLRRSWWWRNLTSSRKQSAEPGGTGDPERMAQLADANPRVDPAAAVAELEAKEAVGRAVWALPEGFRETVALYYFEGLIAPEVAQLTGVREGTVHSRLHRARQLLKTTLNEWGIQP